MANLLPKADVEGRKAVKRRSIEVVVGRLMTDEEFRQRFLRDSHAALRELLEQGMHFTRTEIAAIVATDVGFWERVADDIDPRLQKINLKSDQE
jgi:hypothetical protein